MAEAPTKTLVVVPAFNEQECLPQTLRELRLSVPELDVLVVDDGSRDRTAAVAAAADAAVMQLPFNLGVGGAMRAGYLYAERHGYSVVVQVDADGQHDATAIPLLTRTLEATDADIVIGARFDGVGDYSVRGPRAWAMRLLARVVSRRTRTRLTDVTSGFRAAGPRAVSLFAHNYPADYLGDTVESLLIAHSAGLRITQTPVRMRVRQGGQASTKLVRSSLYLIRTLLVLTMFLARRRARAAAAPPGLPANKSEAAGTPDELDRDKRGPG